MDQIDESSGIRVTIRSVPREGISFAGVAMFVLERGSGGDITRHDTRLVVRDGAGNAMFESRMRSHNAALRARNKMLAKARKLNPEDFSEMAKDSGSAWRAMIRPYER